MDTIPPEAAQAIEEEARKQASTDPSPVAEIGSAVADGTVEAVVEGVGAVLSGVAEAVGAIAGLFDA
ncbi:MAG: hypothetical protein V4653_02595 [Pseudomonadota bacterium]